MRSYMSIPNDKAVARTRKTASTSFRPVNFGNSHYHHGKYPPINALPSCGECERATKSFKLSNIGYEICLKLTRDLRTKRKTVEISNV